MYTDFDHHNNIFSQGGRRYEALEVEEETTLPLCVRISDGKKTNDEDFI